jgi:hypothetical protein
MFDKMTYEGAKESYLDTRGIPLGFPLFLIEEALHPMGGRNLRISVVVYSTNKPENLKIGLWRWDVE